MTRDTIELDIPIDIGERIEQERLYRKDVSRGEFEQLQQCIATIQKSLIRAHQEIIELQADLLAAGIGKNAKKSSIILPSDLN